MLTKFLQYFCHLTISLDCFHLQISLPAMEVQGAEAPHSLISASHIFVEVTYQKSFLLYWLLEDLSVGA